MSDKKDTTEKFILGVKLGMSQIFDDNSKIIPVTLVQAGPCHVLQVRNQEKDNYNAIQLGFLPKRKNNKPGIGHVKKSNAKSAGFRYVREFKLKDVTQTKIGEKIDINTFAKGDKLQVTGISKAKGFQGVVKRHNFRGAPASHGTKHAHRQGGSIGATGPARVFKGTKMAGRMGADTITIKNILVVDIIEKGNILVLKGATPGNNKSLLKMRKI
jgi:large subunit ribosomal protein L3